MSPYNKLFIIIVQYPSFLYKLNCISTRRLTKNYHKNFGCNTIVWLNIDNNFEQH